MKPSLCYLWCLLIGVWSLACRQGEEASPCGMPKQLTVDPACYEGNGLRVTAADYGDSPIGFEWTIRAVQDTTHVLDWTGTDEKIKMDASNIFIVPDSLVTNYQKLIISVAANCQGRLLHSISYGFIRSKAAGSTCTVWKPISQ